MNRKEEVRELLLLTPEDVIERAGNHLVVCEDLDGLHRRFARDIANEIKTRNDGCEPIRFILPVGPVGQYKYLLQILKDEKLDLSACWFFFMDEYCDDDGKVIGLDHPLSFRKVAQAAFLDGIDASLGLKPDQVIFPSDENIDKIDGIIEEIGGIDACFGGVGIHGHVAFNEPEKGIKNLGSRLVSLNDFTVTINAVRAKVGGNLECFPSKAFTIGMKQILASRKIRLYCRNGTPYRWANTILRIALFGEPRDDYPVTHIRGRDYVITTDKDTLENPERLL